MANVMAISANENHDIVSNGNGIALGVFVSVDVDVDVDDVNARMVEWSNQLLRYLSKINLRNRSDFVHCSIRKCT